MDANGRELWRSDGTNAGTYMLVDLRNGNDGLPFNLTPCNGKVFFGAIDDVGAALYVTDGTAAGTVRLGSLALGTGNRFTACHEGVFYAHANGPGVATSELWRSDGTVAGTRAVVAQPGGGSRRPEWFTHFQGQLYFSSAGGLWRTDGTEAGTVAVSSALSAPTWLVANGNLLYFSALGATAGREPYVSDGTGPGTRLLKDINPASDSYPYEFIVANGVTYFGAEASAGSQQMWRTDGTEAGTSMVRSISPGNWSAYGDAVVTADGIVLFGARQTGIGIELWRSDGTFDGTFAVKDLNPGTPNGLPRSFFRAGETLLFSAVDPTYGEELWVTDGTAAGTFLLKDICSGECGSAPNLYP